jgi:hypothetical protein
MRSLNLTASIAIGLAIGGWLCPAARAQHVDTGAEAEGEENPYATKGTFEFGGSVATSWTPSLFELDIKPQVGWFVADRFELSAILSFGYENEVDGGERVSTQSGAFIVEPSYHFPIGEESLFAFGGLGAGVGYDGDNPDFELIPRVGLNIEVGSRGVLSPAVGLPILFGEKKGPNNDEFGVEAGFAVEIGVTTVL